MFRIAILVFSLFSFATISVAQVNVEWHGGPYAGRVATYGSYEAYQNSGSGASYGGSVGTSYSVQNYGSVGGSAIPYGVGYATGVKQETTVRYGVFGLRRAVVQQDVGYMGTTKQAVKVVNGLRGRWVLYADGSRSWQSY